VPTKPHRRRAPAGSDRGNAGAITTMSTSFARPAGRHGGYPAPITTMSASRAARPQFGTSERPRRASPITVGNLWSIAAALPAADPDGRTMFA
jgi:hypothetical protein